ncbi:helix-turn-helix domain-containing protein [Saccharopolyspora sp. NPDC003752]
MSTKPGPSVRRRQLGAMLRKLRNDAGKSRKDAADWIEISESNISRIELGRQAIKVASVRALSQLYNLDADTTEALVKLAREANQRGWWAAYRQTIPEWARQVVGYEADAVELWNYQAEYIPGLLQTPDYLRAITRVAHPEITGDELERLVTLRRERQSQLKDGQPNARYYLNEAVLRRWPTDDPATMRGQLDYVVEASKREYVSIRVVPFSAGLHSAMSSSFVMLQFPDEDRPAFVYIEHDRGSVYQEDPGDVERYMFIADELDKVAMSQNDTRDLLVELARKP